MKIALIGATGFVGSAVLKEAAGRGHHITAIARHPNKLSTTDANVTPAQADVTDIDQLAEVLKGHDVVINAFNAGWSNPDLYNAFLKGSQDIQVAVKKSGVKRYYTIGGAGSLYIAPDKQLVDTPEFPEAYKNGALAARDYLNILKKEHELEWTFLSPAIEMHQGTSGVRKGAYREGLENPVFNEEGRSIISVEDMAIAIVDEVEHPKHIRERYTVGY